MKSIFLAIIFLVFTLSSTAQIVKISAGGSFSKLDWKVNNTKLFDKGATSFTGGIGIEYLNRGVLSLSSNLEFLQRAAKDTIFYTDINGNDIRSAIETARLSYITANTYAKLSPPKGKTKPFVNLGVYAGYLAAVNKLAGSTKDYEKFNFGAVLGLGLVHKIGRNHIGIEANYLPSFNSLLQTTNGSIKDQTFTAKLYYGIKL
jgi:Outer membrane protein beta-barrel domain